MADHEWCLPHSTRTRICCLSINLVACSTCLKYFIKPVEVLILLQDSQNFNKASFYMATTKKQMVNAKLNLVNHPKSILRLDCLPERKQKQTSQHENNLTTGLHCTRHRHTDTSPSHLWLSDGGRAAITDSFQAEALSPLPFGSSGAISTTLSSSSLSYAFSDGVTTTPFQKVTWEVMSIKKKNTI